jgi:hypothetical protein
VKGSLSDFRDEYGAFANSKQTINILLMNRGDPTGRDKTRRTPTDLARLLQCREAAKALGEPLQRYPIGNIFPDKEADLCEEGSFSDDDELWKMDDTAFENLVNDLLERADFDAMCDAILSSLALGTVRYQAPDIQHKPFQIKQSMERFIPTLMNAVDFGRRVDVVLQGSMVTERAAVHLTSTTSSSSARSCFTWKTFGWASLNKLKRSDPRLLILWRASWPLLAFSWMCSSQDKYTST